MEFEQIRDFIILHYHVNQRSSSSNKTDLWQQCRDMPIPTSLQQKIDCFRTTGTVTRYQDELFTEAAWIQVLLGQGVTPKDYNPLANNINQSDLTEFLSNVKQIISGAVTNMPTHNDYIQRL